MLQSAAFFDTESKKCGFSKCELTKSQRTICLNTFIDNLDTLATLHCDFRKTLIYRFKDKEDYWTFREATKLAESNESDVAVLSSGLESIKGVPEALY